MERKKEPKTILQGGNNIVGRKIQNIGLPPKIKEDRTTQRQPTKSVFAEANQSIGFYY